MVLYGGCGKTCKMHIVIIAYYITVVKIKMGGFGDFRISLITKYCSGNGNSNNGIEDTGPEYIVRGDVPLTLIGGIRKAIYPLA